MSWTQTIIVALALAALIGTESAQSRTFYDTAGSARQPPIGRGLKENDRHGASVVADSSRRADQSCAA